MQLFMHQTKEIPGNKNGQGRVCDMCGVCTCVLESKRSQAGRSSIIDSQDLRAVEERDKMMKTLRYYLTHCFTHVTWGTQKSLGG